MFFCLFLIHSDCFLPGHASVALTTPLEDRVTTVTVATVTIISASIVRGNCLLLQPLDVAISLLYGPALTFAFALSLLASLRASFLPPLGAGLGDLLCDLGGDALEKRLDLAQFYIRSIQQLLVSLTVEPVLLCCTLGCDSLGIFF